jgi:hypothetical protein
MVAPILKPWKIWSNVLLTIGAGGFVAVHLLQFGLLGYYTSKRPLEPKPELGWTEPLLWTHGYYGWRAENEQLLRIFNWHFPFFVVAGAGMAMRTLNTKVKNEPWRAK